MDSLLAEIKLHGVILIVVCIVYLTAISSGDPEMSEYYPAVTQESYRVASVRPGDDPSFTPATRFRLTDGLAGTQYDE